MCPKYMSNVPGLDQCRPYASSIKSIHTHWYIIIMFAGCPLVYGDISGDFAEFLNENAVREIFITGWLHRNI